MSKSSRHMSNEASTARRI